MGSAKLKPALAEIVPLKPRRPLTPKQEKFARLYVETGNASEAYRRSYDAEGMQPDAVHVEASRLLADPKITLRVRSIEAEGLAATNLTIGRLVSEGLALLDMAKSQGDVRAATTVLATLGRFHERMAPASPDRRDDMTDADVQAASKGPTGAWLEDLLAKGKADQEAENRQRVAELLDKFGYRVEETAKAESEFAAIRQIDGRAW